MRKLADHEPVAVPCPRCGVVNAELRALIVGAPTGEPPIEPFLRCPRCGARYRLGAQFAQGGTETRVFVYQEFSPLP